MKNSGPILKPQLVRMLDVWIIGPTLVYAAYRLPESEKGLKQALFVFGVGTIGYNYLNWARFNRLTRASSNG